MIHAVLRKSYSKYGSIFTRLHPLDKDLIFVQLKNTSLIIIKVKHAELA